MKKLNSTFVFSIIAGIIVIICFCLYGPRVQAEVEERKEQSRLDGILAEINNLYIVNEELTTQWNELENEQNRLHGAAEQNREDIKNLWNEYHKSKDTGGVMAQICELSPASPLCNDYELLESLKKISLERNVDYRLLLGIMRAESKLGTAFAPTEDCKNTNNWGGVKARKYDDGSVSEWFDKQEGRVEGCWLYKFDSVEDFFESLANTISLGYAKCNNDIYCISKVYVGHESGAWVNNVYKFLVTK